MYVGGLWIDYVFGLWWFWVVLEGGGVVDGVYFDMLFDDLMWIIVLEL